jgi:hypothetical protein
VNANNLAVQRDVVDLLDREFYALIESLRVLVKSVPNDLLYRPASALTIGENILKSAGVVEQTFGGLTANLWDDPFEWTLPETLSTTDDIVDYLSEVEKTRARAFSSFANDAALLKYIAVPSGDPCRLLGLLLETLTRASDYRGQAIAMLKMLSDVSR